MNLDDKLREMARDDQVPLPDGYDEMLSQLYASLASDQGESPEGKETRQMKTRKFKLVRLLAVAAVLALMAASMTVGALAFGRETIVEVPVAQETIVMEDIGLTLILPDDWKGRYVIEDTGDGEWKIYNKYVYETTQDDEWGPAGILFWFVKLDEVKSPAQAEADSPVPCRYLLSTAENTYMLRYTSDVQYNPNDPAETEEYLSMYHQIGDIQIVIDGVMG